MSNRNGLAARKTRVLNRWHAWLAGRVKARAAFVYAPEPRAIGSFAKGRQLVAGNYLFAGHLISAPDISIWDIEPPDQGFCDAIHGFAWLDDLAAVSDVPARARGQEWLWQWIARYGAGRGPGWTPDLTGRRLIRWTNHAFFMLAGRDRDQSAAFYQSLTQQTRFLARRWIGSAPGLPRFEALTGLIYAGLSLENMNRMAQPAIFALARECTQQIDARGGLSTRNPEELLEVFTLLTWAASVLEQAGKPTPEGLAQAIERIAPTLRSLRHSDGGLARFHGGGRGQEGWLDHALASSGIRAGKPEGLAMGFARLNAGRTSIIIDASPPPTSKLGYNAHASTLAFELTSGRRPMIVNCGSGAAFGREWRRAGRATPSHSTLVLDGCSSARLGNTDRINARETLIDTPKTVPVQTSQTLEEQTFEGGHDGFIASHGITHARRLRLRSDGRSLIGEDMLLALKDQHKKTFDTALQSSGETGISYDIHFHLHPEADATLDMNGKAVSIALKSGEIWVFRCTSGSDRLQLEPSVYLEAGRLKPRAGQQIIVSGNTVQYETFIRWSFEKAQDTAIGIRDLSPPQIYADIND